MATQPPEVAEMALILKKLSCHCLESGLSFVIVIGIA